MDLYLSLEDNIQSHPRLPANILPGMGEAPVVEAQRLFSNRHTEVYTKCQTGSSVWGPCIWIAGRDYLPLETGNFTA